MSNFGVGETVVIENTRNHNLYIASVVAQHQSEPNVVYVQYPSSPTERNERTLMDGEFNVRSRKSRLDTAIRIHVGTDDMIARAHADIERRIRESEARRQQEIAERLEKRREELAIITDFIEEYGWEGLSDTAVEGMARFIRSNRVKIEREAKRGNR